MNFLQLSSLNKNRQQVSITLVTSKSESNRVLIMQALSKFSIRLSNLSQARDTQTMIQLLSTNPYTVNVLDAGTTMRFLTAYYALTGREKILTGSKRMQERPIKILVTALKQLGAKIDYLKQVGYPPLKLTGFKQINKAVDIEANISSQYISALLMLAPVLPQGLELKLIGKISSQSYLKMTLALMTHFGITYQRQGNVIDISPQNYTAKAYKIESDWSGASYWYSLVALAKDQNLRVQLEGLRKQSLQGDQVIAKLMLDLGVKTTFLRDSIILSKHAHVSSFKYDFTDCPDLAQTVAVVCAAKGIPAVLKGLHSLPIKETDRLAALQTELTRLGAKVQIESNSELKLSTSTLSFDNPCIQTYNDHRMAMAFAPLAMLAPIRIADPAVVNKSYPSFWQDLANFVTLS